MSDPISPKHYQFGDVQVIDLTEQLNFNRGNVVKYVARAGRKDPAREMEDLLKAKFYLQRELERLALPTREWSLLDNVPPNTVVEDKDGDRYRRINGSSKFQFQFQFAPDEFDSWRPLDPDMYDPGFGPYREVTG